MIYAVAFDDGPLARAALARADEFAAETGAEVVAVTAVARDAGYSHDKGWLDRSEDASEVDVADRLRERVHDIDPEARFQVAAVEGPPGAQAVARALRKTFRELAAEVVFIGSDDAGGIVTPVASVGDRVASEGIYDVHIVRST